MGGGLLRDDKEYPSRFEPGGGTFRDRNVDPKFEHPVLPYAPSQGARDVGGLYPMSPESGEYQKKIYDYEALARLLELLNQSRAQKPYGTPDNARIGF
jgi:hypothetical protein